MKALRSLLPFKTALSIALCVVSVPHGESATGCWIGAVNSGTVAAHLTTASLLVGDGRSVPIYIGDLEPGERSAFTYVNDLPRALWLECVRNNRLKSVECRFAKEWGEARILCINLESGALLQSSEFSEGSVVQATALVVNPLAFWVDNKTRITEGRQQAENAESDRRYSVSVSERLDVRFFDAYAVGYRCGRSLHNVDGVALTIDRIDAAIGSDMMTIFAGKHDFNPFTDKDSDVVKKHVDKKVGYYQAFQSGFLSARRKKDGNQN